MTVSEPRVEPAPDDAPARRSGRIVAGLAALVVVVAIAGSYIKVPYVIFSPGSATPVADYLTIKGTKRYEHEGEVLLLTVSVSNGRPNLWRYVQANLDDDSRIIGEHDYYGDVSRAKAERQSVQMMTESQLSAKQAALTKLGYDVQISGAGARVAQLVEGSPAARGGIEVGDVIVAVDGEPVEVRDQLGAIVQRQPAGTTFTITVQRHGKTRDLVVTSGTAPSGELAGKPYLGVGTITEDLEVAFPVDVRIDAGDVSGPSGGLAFALTIIDDLTPGDLTGGKKVAVTGEIDGAGNVSQVGGVAQKAVAARDAGARLMIVPKGEVAEARPRAGSMKVVGVDSLDGALRVLRRNGGAPLAVPAPAA